MGEAHPGAWWASHVRHAVWLQVRAASGYWLGGWVAGSWVAGGWWSPPCVLFLTVTVRASTRQRCRGQDPVRGPHALREEGTPRLAQKRSHGACGWR